MRRAFPPAWLAALAILPAAVCACGASPGSSPASATGNKTVSITIGLPTSKTSFANSDVAIAQAEGYFSAQGLDVHTENLSSGVPVVDGVVGGSLTIGASSIEPVVNAAAHGAPVQVIGSYANKLTVEMVTPTSITSPAQLRGKRLGIQQVGAFREVMTRMVLEGAGLTTSDVTYVPGSASGYISALIQGTIQSGVLQVEQAGKVLAKDRKLHVLVNFSQARPGYFYGAYVVTKSWLAANQDVARRFLTAITLAHRFMYQHKSATVAIVARTTGFTPAVISKAYDVLLTQEGVFPVNEGLSASVISGTIATMKRYQILSGPAPAESSLVDTAPVAAVVGKLGAWKGDPRWN